MNELFPELAKLSGGRKQAWINEHLDVIAAVHDIVGFDRCREVFRMKSDTLISALTRAERHHRPAITAAEKAYLVGQRAEIKADQALGELETQAEVIELHMADDDRKWELLKQYVGLVGRASTMFEELMSSVSYTRNFTEHIIRAPKRKVGPSQSRGRGRPLLSCPGRRLSYPGRLRSEHCKARRPRRV